MQSLICKLCLRGTCWMSGFPRWLFTDQSETERDESFRQDGIDLDAVYGSNPNMPVIEWVNSGDETVIQNNCVYVYLLRPQCSKESCRVRLPGIGWERHGHGRDAREVLLKKTTGESHDICEMASQTVICLHEVYLKYGGKLSETCQNCTSHPFPLVLSRTNDNIRVIFEISLQTTKS